jgi:hypothetical protein
MVGRDMAWPAFFIAKRMAVALDRERLVNGIIRAQRWI